MKSILSIFAVALIGFSASAQKEKTAQSAKAAKQVETTKDPVAPITFKTLEINKQNIAYGADETFTFDFKNTGNTPVIVSNVQTSCGCTTAEKPTEPIQPGKSSKISVKYDTKRVGDFTKTITVTTNVGEPIVLTIKGKVAAAPTTTEAAPASK